ncbi:MAG: hypothetical protein DRJ47_11370 [Thermoprotei archaeon]|nr:MAG: hypothetical protein DRJ47_11370 [Thermoprotei archaeon]
MRHHELVYLSLSNAASLLENLYERRELLIKKARDLIKKSKEVIVNVYLEKWEDAERKISELNIVKAELENMAKTAGELYYSSTVRDSLAEYVEAIIYFRILKDNSFPELNELEVPPIPYIMGVLDVAGELRRSILKFLREERLDDAERLLKFIESIYEALSPHILPDSLVPGFRRKLDIVRQLFERSLSDILYVSRPGKGASN